MALNIRRYLSLDPDGILEREGVGRCVEPLGPLVADVEELMQNERPRNQMGRRARARGVNRHNVESMSSSREALLREVCRDACK